MAVLIGILLCLFFSLIVFSIVGYIAKTSFSSHKSMDMGFLTIKDDRWGDERSTNYLLFVEPTVNRSTNRMAVNLPYHEKEPLNPNMKYMKLADRVCICLLITIFGIFTGYLLFKIYSLLI